MGSATLARAGIATAATMGLFIAWLLIADESSGSAFGLAVVYLAPATLGLIGHRRNDGPTLAAAAIMCMLATVTSFSLVTIPFLLPAALLAVAALGSTRRLSWRPRSVLGASIAELLVVAAWLAAVGMFDAHCFAAAENGACRTSAGGVGALVLIVLAIVVATAATARPATPPIIPSDGHPADARRP